VRDDDVSDDGTPLPGNPVLRDVVPAGASDRTSMIDLEAIEAKRAARRAEAARDSADVEPDDGTVDNDRSATAVRHGDLERDVDATGTLARRSAKGRAARFVKDADTQRRTAPPEPSVVQPAQQPTADPSVMGASRFGLTRGGGSQQLKRPPSKKKPLSAATASALVALVVVGLMVGVFLAARATGVLTVTTVPLGAAVVLDGEPLGTSPLQKRVRTGSHMIELSLDGFEPFREVVTVPSDGLSFLQPLKALPPPPPPPPTSQEVAADIAAQVKRLFDAGDLDGASARIAELLRVMPGHEPSRELRATVAKALEERDARAAERQQATAAAGRVMRARQLADEGLRLYQAGKLGPARTALYDATKLDPKNPDPHRTLAKIFNREDDLEKVRYHLERFLALGGNDGDFKVREWLKSHPQ
jgi:hypothetical protein